MKKKAALLQELSLKSTPKTPQNTCRKCGELGLPSTCLVNYHDRKKNFAKEQQEFFTKDVNCLKCVKCGHSWIPAKEKSPMELFQERVAKNTEKYVKYVMTRCEELARKGYGSVLIKIDRTTDIFMQIESDNKGYSADHVVSLLLAEGFKLKQGDDFYDAVSYILTWSDLNLPEAPDSEKIGMAYK